MYSLPYEATHQFPWALDHLSASSTKYVPQITVIPNLLPQPVQLCSDNEAARCPPTAHSTPSMPRTCTQSAGCSYICTAGEAQ